MLADLADTGLIARLRSALHESQQRVTMLEASLTKEKGWHREQAAEASKLQRECVALRTENGRLVRALALAGAGVP